MESRILLTGTWTTLTHAAPGAVGTMLLLPDGSVIAPTDGDSAGSDWARLTPSLTGGYVAGTWTKLANANNTRLFDSTDVLQDGSVFLAGGEYGTGASTGEVYNPLTNTWTRTPSQSYGEFLDSWSTLLPNGNVLITPVVPSPSGYTTIYNPTSNTWSQGPKLYRGSSADETSWVKLADGSILTVDGNTTSERYIPATNKFVNDATVPVAMTDSLGEYGPAFLLASGKAFFIGASGHSAIYTPSGTTSPGSWVAGPDIPGGLGQDDASGVVLRDGTVLITAGPIDSYNGPTSLFIYDPIANTYTAVSGPNTYSGAPFLTRMLALPNGDVLYSENGSTLYQYDPGTTALAAAVPVINSVVANTDGSLTLTGTNLNGINTGGQYGDDAQMDSNYPIIQLISGSNVYYARSYNWTNTGVMLGSTLESVTFTLPLGISPGTYSLVATANGVPSVATSLTISTTMNNAAPTVATAASVATTPVSGTTAALSVLGADDGGESNLVYTWTNTSAPSGASLASFSDNGTNTAKAVTATFHKAGSYTFNVTITDAGGLSVSGGTVTVVVSQTLTSTAITPTPVNLTTGQSQQLTATGYDQFGNSMTTQPTFTWALASGTGNVSATGKYTAPASGTMATVTATTGTFQATVTIGVVNSPWISADIGSVGIAGIAYDSTTTTTLTDGASDVYGTSDAFHYDYRSLTGNGSITTKINSQTSASTYIKAGLMFRNTLDSASAQISLFDPSPGPLLEWRSAASGSTTQTATTPSTAETWLRLVRNGSVFTGYASVDGTTWTQIGSSQTITMNSTIYVGLADCSRNAADLATVVFSNVVVSQPSVATAAAASPSSVTGTTATLSVLGANTPNPAGEASLTYTWVATNVPTGAASPTFSANGTNAAKSTVATFQLAGSYTFTVTISDSVLSVTSVVTVVVNQTLTSIVVAPATAVLSQNAAQNFNATGYDQFSTVLTTQPTFTWSKTAGIGSISSSTGLYTAPGSTGTATVQAASGLITATASVTITNAPPTDMTAASASPSPVTGTTAALSVLGTDDGGESNLTYTWVATTIPNSAAAPTYSINGTNAAKYNTVTFYKAGSYVFTVTIADSMGLTTTSSVSVIVSQTLTALSIPLTNASVVAGGTVQIGAVDQFGDAFAPTINWSVNGGGSIGNTGVFTAGQAGGTYTITGANGSSTKTVAITVVPAVYTDTADGDTYAIRLSAASSSIEQIFVNTPETATPTYSIAVTQLSTLAFTPAGGDGTLTVDFTNGNPLPSGGISYVCGPHPTTGGNSLFLAGVAAGNMIFSINAGQITDTAVPSSPVTYSNLQGVEFDLQGSGNTLTQLAQPSAPVIYNAGTGNNTLNVSDGSFTISADPKTGSGNLTINDGSALVFTQAAANSGFNARRIAALNLTGNATAVLQDAKAHTDRLVLSLGSLSMSSSSQLDLGGNDMIVQGGDLGTISKLVGQGFQSGRWTGTGITSSTAANDTTHLTALGAILNINALGTTLYPTFDGQTGGLITDVLVKYTYYGDATLDGKVDGSDYSRIDSASLGGSTGWFNGDFNYDQTINGSDYTLIDNTFNTQGTSLPLPVLSTIAGKSGGGKETAVESAPHPAAVQAASVSTAVFSDTPLYERKNTRLAKSASIASYIFSN